MKKKILTLGLTIVMMLTLVGCNKTMFDTTYSYDRAIIALPNGDTIEVEIDSWCDYEGEQLQIKAEDGTIYLTSSFNCVMIKDADQRGGADVDGRETRDDRTQV